MKELVNVSVPKPKGVEEVTAPEGKKKTVGERIIEAEEDALVHEATKKAHGLGQGGQGSVAEQPDSLAPQIVTNSMKQTADAVKEMKDNEKDLQKEIKEANAAVGQMQNIMTQELLTRIEKAQTKLDESAKVAQGVGAPQTAFDGYKQVKGELSSLVGEIQKSQSGVETQQPGMSDATQIRLKELELQQQQVLAQITADNTRAHEQFQLQMLEFKDNKEVRHLEYENKSHFRQEGIQGVSDLVNALGAGVSQKGGPGSNPGSTVKEQAGEEAEAGAYISSFKCGVCAADIPVEAGQTVVKCPGCGAGFSIKAKE